MILLQLTTGGDRHRDESIRAIYNDLDTIMKEVDNEKLSELFNTWATHLCSSRSRRNDEKRLSRVASVVQKTREGINRLCPRQRIPNPERCEKEVFVLVKGCAGLNEIKQKRPLPPNQFDAEIKTATDADEEAIKERIKRLTQQMEFTPRKILVRFMDEPDREPTEITAQRKYSGYAEIRWQLINESLVHAVDLWIRHENDQEQSSTPNYHYWEYAHPKCVIKDDKETLEIDVVEIQNRIEYIVAVLREESDKEIPMPLDIGRGGGNCCQNNCGTLRFHLQNLWPSHIVTEAIRLSDPVNTQATWCSTLSDECFEHRTNDLYLCRKPKGSPQQ
ncbi:hypothetical protein CPB86DRAFT_214881 [Serendipita vermifera]|nr:hypothetical protein CPB86DRAFT_214881 [Serendipita vermifera]